MTYVWDPRKSARNVRKHGIAFGDAVEVFAHPMLACIDLREDYGEERWVGIGFVKDITAVVAYTQDDDRDVTRIISARKATRHEEDQFKRALGH